MGCRRAHTLSASALCSLPSVSAARAAAMLAEPPSSTSPMSCMGRRGLGLHFVQPTRGPGTYCQLPLANPNASGPSPRPSQHTVTAPAPPPAATAAAPGFFHYALFPHLQRPLSQTLHAVQLGMVRHAVPDERDVCRKRQYKQYGE